MVIYYQYSNNNLLTLLAITEDGQCKKPELVNTSSDKPSQVMASWTALLDPNTRAVDVYPKMRYE